MDRFLPYIFIFICGIISLIIYLIIFCIIRYIFDKGKKIKKEFFNRGIDVSFVKFKRITLFKDIYKSSIPLKYGDEHTQYFELIDISMSACVFYSKYLIFPLQPETELFPKSKWSLF